MEEGRGEKGPEGYLQCWIAPVLDIVKERKQEIWEKVNLSLTPWLATMCYPQRESSQTERESGGEGEGRRLSNFILSEERKKKKDQQKWKKMRSSCGCNSAVSGKDNKSLQSSLYQRDDNSSSASHGYYHTVGSPMHKRFIQLHSVHSL